MTTQNGESSRGLLLSVTNRTALAPGWDAVGGVGGAQLPRAPFKTFIMLLPVTFSLLDPQLVCHKNLKQLLIVVSLIFT